MVPTGCLVSGATTWCGAADGDDFIDGGVGNDQTRDGAGDDTVIGGIGNDRFIDDPGTDSLVYSSHM